MDWHRCAHEKTCYANRQDADRSNTKTSKRVQKEMRIEMEQSRPTVGSNDEDLATVYGFQYLGHWFEVDGGQEANVQRWIAMARRTFGDMRKAWDTKRLSDNVKLRMYEAMVISRLVYGHEAYVLDEKTKKALRNFNARCLHRITGREYSAESSEATTTFDIIGKLRARRLQWLGHMLRASKDRLIHVAVAQMIDHRQDGDLLSDAPAHDGSIEKLIELAEDRDEWRKRVHKLAPKKKVNKRAASTEEEEYKNHKQDMPWADSQKSQKQMRERSEAERQIAALPVGSIIAYTDGGDSDGAVGWGASIWEKTGPAHDDCKLLDELWGPVVTDAGSTWYLGADTESNNTAEMTAMAETCLFSKAQGGTAPLTMVFDSRYAANATQGKQKKAESNLELAAVCNKLYVEEKKRRNVQLIWVRGHSGNKGNDRADLLAQWGKASGPHSRIPLRGETKERAKSRAELRKKIEELQKAEQKAKPSSTNQNNQNNQNNNMNMNDNDEDSPNEDDSDDGRVAVCGVASAEAIAASHASDPGGHCGRPQSPRLTAATGSSPPSESG